MQQTAFLIGNRIIYGYSLIAALSLGAALFFFLHLCKKCHFSYKVTNQVVILVLVLSLIFGRLLYWDCRPDQFHTLLDIVLDTSAAHFALAGVFFACAVSAFAMRKKCNAALLLDCMSLTLCGGICLGRLGFFFTAYDRGQISQELTAFPWIYPAMNPVTGLPEYRVATFLLQSALAGVLFFCLLGAFARAQRENLPEGRVTAAFLLVYCAGQVLLDSTRYDSLYFRFNGFVSMVQVLSAFGLAGALAWIGVQAKKNSGVERKLIFAWTILPVLIGTAGYMEYYVQRHARQALFSYLIMEHCLAAIAALGLWQLRKTYPKK